MDRKEFLSLLGLSSVSLVAASCLGGCSKNASSSGNSNANVDFTIDLADSAYATLQTKGNSLYYSGVIVARTLSGNYIAVSQTCTHQGGTVVYQKDNSRFYCDNHGASFSESGAVTGGPAGSALKQYNTSISGTKLRIYS